MEDDSDESLEVLRNLLAKIMMEILQKGYGYEHKVIETTHNLIACLISDFQYFVMEDGRFVNEVRNKGNKILSGRLNRITDYMYENYSRKLTLGEIADREHPQHILSFPCYKGGYRTQLPGAFKLYQS